MDPAHFTAKERKQARKALLKKIEGYNKQAKKSRSSSFQMTSPTKFRSATLQDLVYKGIVKVTYDRGYALQTKSLLMENTTTTADAVVQLFEALGLRGSPSDYALEERNIVTGEIRLLGAMETPLNLQLNYGSHQSYMELRLVQMRDTLAAPPLSASKSKGVHRGSRPGRGGDGGSDSDETLSNGSNPNDIVPKEEVIDHGIASVELVMEEALQDIPTLVHDIQERLKRLSESVAVDGKPRPGLPNRRLLWDILKPQASTLVKDIRRLVDNGEFLSSKHAKSPVVKLMVTLLLELITDHSRELVTVTKEMCGLKGAAKTDFDSSVSLFTQQITYISKLVGKANESLHAMALVGHLLEATNPEILQQGKLTGESYFSGSGSVSGVLLFTVVSAHLGLVRAAYEEKHDFYASLATNMLRSSQRALETIQKTDEYGMLHLHPLRSRVRDMEHKLKVAMDNLIRGVKLASSQRSPPDAGPELLLSGHALIMATLDFLMVAQCASLVHKVVIAGWELLQFPWVRALADNNPDGKSDSAAAPSFSEQLSSLGSDSTSSQSTGTDSGVYQRSATVERMVGERRSRIHGPYHQRESGDGMDAAELAAHEKKMNVGQLGMSAKHLLPFYQREIPDSGEEADDERAQSYASPITVSPPATPRARSETEDDFETTDVDSTTVSRSIAFTTSTAQPSTRKQKGPSSFELDSSHYMGIDAVKKLRMHYNVNKAIAKCAESLLLSATQKINVLSLACQKKAKDKYAGTVELILGAARQIREEVSSMEVDILVSENMTELLERTRPQMDSITHEVHMATLAATSSSAPDSAEMKIMSAVGKLKELCSKTVAEALSKVKEHKKAVEQAEKIEQEFVSLMTGQKRGRKETADAGAHASGMTRYSSSPATLMMGTEMEAAGLVFEGNARDSLTGGARAWTAKESPRIIGGTVDQLIQRLTYHRVIDPEFTQSFLLSFHSFMSPEKLIDSLITRYNVEPTEGLSALDHETFEINLVIPIQLRVINAVRIWLNLSYNDFKEETMWKKLQTFIELVNETMPSCARQLRNCADISTRTGPQRKPRRQAPTPLAPMTLSQGDNFDLLDVNTLELARQLTLAFSNVLRGIQPQELLSFAWRDESRHGLIPHIMEFLYISSNLTELVQREVLRESAIEDQTSVLSYFIQTAKSCLDLKNYEAVFSIVAGLESNSIQQIADSWQLVTEKLKSTYKQLREITSAEMNFQRYRQEIQAVHQTPCVPRLNLVLLGLEEVHKNHSDFLPDAKDVINFGKRREYAKLIQELQRYQTYPYNLHPIETMQKYLENMKKVLTEAELEKLSTKVEAFTI